jgi:hypothetical protein
MWRELAIWWLGMLAAITVDSSAPPLENALQDGQGVIWGCGHGTEGQVYRFTGADWIACGVPFDAKPDTMPIGLGRMTDGAVAIVWRDGANDIAVTRHLGTESTLLGTGPGEIPQGNFYGQPLADSKNRLWIAGEMPAIYRIDGKGQPVKLIHKIEPNEWINPNDARGGINKISVVEDGHGRVWAWSQSTISNYARLRNVLIFTGDTCEERDILPAALKGRTVLTIAKADATHMWITVADDGVYKLDIDTFALERTPDPAPKALCCVHELYVRGDDLYAIEEHPQSGTELWRYRAGQWTKIVPLFEQGTYPWFVREWLPIKEGLLITTFFSGPWFLPNEGEPAQFTWKTGFAYEDFHAVSRLADGTFFGLGRQSEIFHGTLTLPPKGNTDARVLVMGEDRGWATDATGHFWIVPGGAPATLREWDGTQWIDHPPPPGNFSPDGLMEDDQGRIWINSSAPAFFDPRSGQWQTYANRHDAMLASLGKPFKFLRDQWFRAPSYSADGKRVAYRDGVIWIEYYDGAVWHHFTRADIMGKKDDDNAVGPPWFDDQGLLHVNMRNKMSFVRDDSGKWSEIPWVSHFQDDIWSENASAWSRRPSPPEGSVTATPDGIVADNLGTIWMLWQGMLYRAIPGFCVPFFSRDEFNPFASIHDLREAFVDGRGNVFVQTASTTLHWTMIRPKGAAPSTKITLEPKASDYVVAHFDARTTAPVRFRWRLDDDNWYVSDTTAVILEHLPNGPHVLRVVAMDDELNMDPEPVEAKFETRIDSAKQIAALIAQLSDPDYDQRKAAVEALAQQPAAALVALEQARADASDDLRWWIAAATQECQRHTAAKKPDAGSGR